MELAPEVTAVAESVQAMVNASDEPGLVTQVVVLYEVASVGEDGDTARQINYTVPSDNFALSGALGLVEAGRVLIGRSVLGPD